MYVALIEDLNRFDALREEWEAAYEADADANIFLSWIWMRRHLSTLSQPWVVLAWSEERGRPFKAFFPLKLFRHQQPNGFSETRISMAGNYVADYTGILSFPDVGNAAASAFAATMLKLRWSHIRLDYIRGPEGRLRQLLRGLRELPQIEVRHNKRTNYEENIDNLVCPHVRLPDSWDQFLTERMSSNSRQKIRRLLRQMEQEEDLDIVLPNKDNIDQGIETLLELWTSKWGERKGERLPALLRSNRRFLRNAFEDGLLFMPMMTYQGRPVAVNAVLEDRTKGELLFYMAGRDESFQRPAPGLLLHGFSIRYAISQGYRSYDFLRGNEPYKYTFGCEERLIHSVGVRAAGRKRASEVLDPRNAKAAFERARSLEREGQLAMAENAYRQIIALSPRSVAPLAHYARLLHRTSRFDEAIKVFRVLLKLMPDDPRVNRGLQASMQARSRAVREEAPVATAELRDTIRHTYFGAAARRSREESLRSSVWRGKMPGSDDDQRLKDGFRPLATGDAAAFTALP